MTDPLIRAAFEAIAATAPPPERIRARIAARARVHRQRRLVLAGVGALGGAAAATAIGAPLLARSGSGGTAGVAAPSASGAPSASRAPSPAPTVFRPDGIPFLFGPGWLPDGLTEQYREVSCTPAPAGSGAEPAGFASRRSWLPAGAAYPEDHSPPPGITWVIGEHFDNDGEGDPVPVGTEQGRLLVTADMAMVSWRHDERPMRVTAYQLPNQADLVLRVARSMAPTLAGLPLTMHLADVPQRFAGNLVAGVHPRPGGWLYSLTSMTTDRTHSCTVIASTGAAPAHTFARAGRPGGVTLWVPDEQEASANFTRDEADKALRDLFWSAPDLSWVGKRVA
ncbi:hypothetical protein [Dactylosporangium sp. NPDC049140]|uniref:hypothetical protein n=1 Tax=Dactylosporangium sp. NPDC049140 TaxID=3155647 RepID=UPI0033C0EB36